MTDETLADAREVLGDGAVLCSHAQHGDATIAVEAERISEHLALLRDAKALPYNFLMDLTVVDHPGRDARFEVVYHLASIDAEPRGGEPCTTRARLRVKAAVPQSEPVLPSVAAVHPAADWMEREAFDLYGVRFAGHPDLRRILLYDEFEGHPLRKDYPRRRRQPLVGVDP